MQLIDRWWSRPARYRMYMLLLIMPFAYQEMIQTHLHICFCLFSHSHTQIRYIGGIKRLGQKNHRRRSSYWRCGCYHRDAWCSIWKEVVRCRCSWWRAWLRRCGELFRFSSTSLSIDRRFVYLLLRCLPESLQCPSIVYILSYNFYKHTYDEYEIQEEHLKGVTNIIDQASVLENPDDVRDEQHRREEEHKINSICTATDARFRPGWGAREI